MNWNAPPVRGDFDQNVWRRIRMRQPAGMRAGWVAWLYSPLRIATAAALIAIALGSWAGLRSAHSPAPGFVFAGEKTITGTYLRFSKGSSP